MFTLTKRLLVLATSSCAAAMALAPAAQAAAPCPNVPEARVLAEGLGSLESIAINPQGQLYFTDSTNGQLLTLRKPGAKPKVVTDGIDGPGGIVFQKRHVLVGFGDSLEQGGDGIANPEAGLLRVDPKTGESTIFTEGLQMANGVARGPGGTIFASTDFGTGIDRITNRGADVELNWTELESPNGLVVDSKRKYLYAAQTFTSSAIQRISLDDPTDVTPAYVAPPAEAGGGFDGLARDAQDTLYVAANLGGQILKITGPDTSCSLAELPRFPLGPSALFFGRGDGKFDHDSLFVVTFGGQLIELPNAR